MPDDPRLADLLLRWEEGGRGSPDELCRDCPELLEPLRRRAEALRAMDAVLGDTLPSTLVPPAGVPPSRPAPAWGGYEMLEELGRGGMGVVYKARQIGLNRLVAIKTIRAGAEARPVDLARFRTEAETVAGLRHPNIVQVYEVGESEGQPFIVLELVEGGNLGHRLAIEPPTQRETARLTETLARTIHVAHRAGVIHRDLKPANVLLSVCGVECTVCSQRGSSLHTAHCTLPTCQPKITDFGLAKHFAADAGPTVTGTVLGTPSYMAPEQANGQVVGPFTDVYALGAILYECLTGRPPFLEDTPWNTIRRLSTTDPIPPHRLRPEVARDLETICLKCLEKDPARRYASALDLADDLRRFLDDRPILARPAGVFERAVKWSRRRPAAAALLVVSALALLAIVTGAVLHDIRIQAALRQARDHAEESRRRLVRLHVSQGAHLLDEGDWLAALPWFAEALRLDEGHPEREAMHRLRIGGILTHSPSLTQAWLHEGPIRFAGFSPDSRRVLTASDDGSARVWDVQTGQTIGSPLRHGSPVLHAAFSPDGRAIATGGRDGAVRLWLDGRSQTAFPKHGGEVRHVAFSPDGGRVLSASADRTARLWASSTGELLATMRHDGIVQHAAFSGDGRRVGTASADGTPRVWNAQTGTEVARLVGHRGGVRHICFHPDGQRVLTAGEDGSARLWERETGKPFAGPLRHQSAVVWGSLSPDGSRIVTGSDDNTACVWGADRGEPLAPPMWHSSGVNTASFGPEGRRIITASDDNTARIWDAATGEAITPMLRHSGSVQCAELSPDGRWALTAGNDGVVCLWGLGGIAQPVADPPASVEAPPLATRRWHSPDGRWLVTGEGEYSARVQDARTGAPHGPTLRHGSTVLFAAFSDDGERLVTASDDNTARLWVVGAGEEQALALRHAGSVRLAAFSPDRRLVVTADDHTARVWDAATGEPITPALRFTSTVRRAAFAADGVEARITSANGARRTWLLREDGQPVETLVQLAEVLASARVDPARGLLPLLPEQVREHWERYRPRGR